MRRRASVFWLLVSLAVPGAASCAQVLGGAPDVPPLADDGGVDAAIDAPADGTRPPTDGSDATIASDTGADTSVANDGAGEDAPNDGAGEDAPTGLDAGHDGASLDAGVDAAPPSSCAVSGPGTGKNCGGVGGTTDCCESLAVPGGVPFHTAVFDAGFTSTVSTFRLDTFEVTAGRFRGFVKALGSGISGWIAGTGTLSPPPNAGKHTHVHFGNGLQNTGSGGGYEGGWQSGWPAMPTAAATWSAQLSSCTSTLDTWNASEDTLPISCVDWYQAYAFCIWDGGFLPSVAEFNYAFTGGTDEWTYPWGSSAPTPSLANYAPGFTGPGAYNKIAPVGSLSAGAARWGQLDVAGNLWEWVLDWGDTPSTSQSCVDCADTSSSEGSRILRGGDFTNGIDALTSTNTTSDNPSTAYGNYGFRCARAP
jgi:formylglycine-generating enzyme required for sulfatase activity